jgi:transcriptional regulator with XRE-family HTH domain
MIRERLKKRRDTHLSVAKQPRPRGVGQPVTRQWKELVQRELDDRGMTRAQLAKLTGVTPGAVTVFFRPATKTCRFVDEIVKVLGVPRPEYADNREAEVFDDLRQLRRLSQADFDDIASRARAKLQRLLR